MQQLTEGRLALSLLALSSATLRGQLGPLRSWQERQQLDRGKHFPWLKPGWGPVTGRGCHYRVALQPC